jgi:hypothetical protein
MQTQLTCLLVFFFLHANLLAAPTSNNDARNQDTQGKIEPPEILPFVERDQRQFSFYPGGKLQIVTGIPGNIKIIGWQKASVLLEVEKIIYHIPADQAKLISSQYPLQLRWTQTNAVIRTTGPPESAAKMEMNLTLYVPKEKTDIDAKILQGDFAIGGINGWVEATLTEGSVEATSMSGYFSAFTQLGDLSIVMSGNHWIGHTFTAVTQKGSVQLQLPPDYSTALTLETRAGEITIDYPDQQVEGQTIPFKVVAKKKKGKSLVTPIGRSGAPIKLLTLMGNIEFSSKK